MAESETSIALSSPQASQRALDAAATLRTALEAGDVQVVPWKGNMAVLCGSVAEVFELGQLMRGARTPAFAVLDNGDFVAFWPLPWVPDEETRMREVERRNAEIEAWREATGKNVSLHEMAESYLEGRSAAHTDPEHLS